MPGPTPKNPKTRQRRNKASTATTLSIEAKFKAPALPRTRTWQTLTIAWWKDVWRSPMAPEFLQADVHGLYILADLVDRYWLMPGDTKLASEIRLQRQCFGLTPIDRRRLQWEVERVEQTKSRGNKAPIRSVKDPRDILRLVK